ncbi:Retrovirus-related Pol polyprotein from transposon [Abeliophyllum distichum]|uniref:Retrovirus-related Pol polyprotein from transposon n=1 Tax=Abeliophyllum distichum TaxID=126358 RepID=A0ABD1V5L4_9LAMI
MVNRMFPGMIGNNMELNPLKWTFRVASGKFLDNMVNQRGIEANPEKIRALIEMRSPSSPKEVQSLTGRLVALNRFISKAIKRGKSEFGPDPGGRPGTASYLLCKQCLPRCGNKKDTPEAGHLRKTDEVAVELSQFDISYKPRPSIKGQALADFVVEFAHIPVGSLETHPEEVPTWNLYVDGSSREVGAGARAEILLIRHDGHNLNCALSLGV